MINSDLVLLDYFMLLLNNSYPANSAAFVLPYFKAIYLFLNRALILSMLELRLFMTSKY